MAAVVEDIAVVVEYEVGGAFERPALLLVGACDKLEQDGFGLPYFAHVPDVRVFFRAYPVFVVPRAADPVAAHADPRELSALAEGVFEGFCVVAHEHERRLFEIVQIHVRELPARFLGGLRNAEAVRVPLAPVAVSADVYRAYVRVAVVALGELSDEARMKFYQQRLVEIRRVARHGGERAFRVLPLLLPVVGLVFYALVERPLRRGVGLFAVVVGAGYAERHRQPDLGVIFDELVDFRPVVFAVLGLEVRPVVPAVS